MIYAIAYIIGFLIMLIFLSHFGKALGFDYNGKDKDYDDWDSNAQAYAAFSLAWPMFIVVVIFVGIWKLIMMVSNFFVKD